jgi:hypothetical protein
MGRYGLGNYGGGAASQHTRSTEYQIGVGEGGFKHSTASGGSVWTMEYGVRSRYGTVPSGNLLGKVGT